MGAAGFLNAPRLLLLALAMFSLAGAAMALWLRRIPAGNPDPRRWYNVFYVLFARNEPLGLSLVALFSVLAAFLIFRRRPQIESRQFLRAVQTSEYFFLLVIALAVLAIAGAGTNFVSHEYALSADENMADFQAQIFLSGKIYQEVPEFWQPMLRAVLPTHATYIPRAHGWLSGYLPVYAAIRAVFMSVGLQWFTNPVLAAISIFALAAVARRIWPNERWKPVLAAGLLAASPQFLVTSMTAYAMPAHLALNLVWLWLYCDPSKRRFWLAPFVGVAAMGLHQPFFHALFAAPFLFRLVLDRRWKASAWFAAVYLVGAGCWYAWWYNFVPANTAGAGTAFGFARQTLLVQAIYVCLLLGWLALPVPLLAVLGFGRWRQMTPLLRDICASCLVTFGFYIFVYLDQAHGWGDRYFHGTLGCLILVAVAGWDRLAGMVGRRAAVTFVVVGGAAALFLQVPLRSLQAERFVRPYARAAEYISSIDAEVVGFDPRLAWYSNDLKRNDPLWRQGPIVLSLFGMKEAQIETVLQRYPRAHLITREELAAFELVTELSSDSHR